MHGLSFQLISMKCIRVLGNFIISQVFSQNYHHLQSFRHYSTEDSMRTKRYVQRKTCVTQYQGSLLVRAYQFLAFLLNRSCRGSPLILAASMKSFSVNPPEKHVHNFMHGKLGRKMAEARIFGKATQGTCLRVLQQTKLMTDRKAFSASQNH